MFFYAFATFLCVNWKVENVMNLHAVAALRGYNK